MITLFTPTYNRVHLLSRLYNSILMQDVIDVEWLIVDDGSIDDTEALIENFKKESIINIRYYKKFNGGKHTAINFGLQYAKGELFFIIDSDDVLAENALKIIKTHYQSIKNNDKICGIVGLSQYIDKQEIVGDYFLRDDWEVSFADIYLKYHLKGDKSVAFKTEVLRKYPFPEKQGVRFVFEAVVWHEMSKKYKVLAINNIIQYKEYTNEGITRNTYKKDYLRGLAFSFFHLIKNKTYPLLKYPHHFFWNYIHLAINSLLSGESYYKQLSLIDKMLYLILYPRAYYTFLKLKDKVHD